MTVYGVVVRLVDGVAASALFGVILVGLGFLLLPLLYLIEWAGGTLKTTPAGVGTVDEGFGTLAR